MTEVNKVDLSKETMSSVENRSTAQQNWIGRAISSVSSNCATTISKISKLAAGITVNKVGCGLVLTSIAASTLYAATNSSNSSKYDISGGAAIALCSSFAVSFGTAALQYLRGYNKDAIFWLFGSVLCAGLGQFSANQQLIQRNPNDIEIDFASSKVKINLDKSFIERDLVTSTSKLDENKPSVDRITINHLEPSTLDLCENRLTEAKKELLSCTDAKKLWDEVESKGSFVVKCDTLKYSDAFVNCDEREIHISKTSNEMVDSLLFELNNLKQADKFLQFLGKKMCHVEADNFAIAQEEIEYESVLNSYNILKKCVSNGAWPKSLSRLLEGELFTTKGDGDWDSFEGYLKTQEEYGHTNYYRAIWNKKCLVS